MNAKRKAPSPILDNLEYLGNPFKQKHFDTSQYLGEYVAGADIDLEYAMKYLYSYNGSSATFNSYRREIERLLQWSWRISRSNLMHLFVAQLFSFYTTQCCYQDIRSDELVRDSSIARTAYRQ